MPMYVTILLYYRKYTVNMIIEVLSSCGESPLINLVESKKELIDPIKKEEFGMFQVASKKKCPSLSFHRRSHEKFTGTSLSTIMNIYKWHKITAVSGITSK